MKVLYSIREIHYRKMMRMFLVFWATVWHQALCLRTMNADHQPDVGVETGTDYNIVLPNSTPLSFLQKVFLQKSCKPEETKAGTCSETDDQKRNSTKKGNKSTPRKNKFLGSPAKSIESKEEFLDEDDSENGGDSSEENDGANNVNGNKGNMEKAVIYSFLALVGLGLALLAYLGWKSSDKRTLSGDSNISDQDVYSGERPLESPPASSARISPERLNSMQSIDSMQSISDDTEPINMPNLPEYKLGTEGSTVTRS